MFAAAPVTAILAKHVPEEVIEEDGTGWIDGGYTGSSFTVSFETDFSNVDTLFLAELRNRNNG